MNANIEEHRVNTLRIDFTPKERIADLDIAKGQKLLKIRRHGFVQRREFTVKYTSSLYFQVWFKHYPFHIDEGFKVVYKLRRSLNAVRKNTCDSIYFHIDYEHSRFWILTTQRSRFLEKIDISYAHTHTHQ